MSTRLCDLQALREGESLGFAVDSSDGAADVFLVRQGAQVFGYRNRCPHTGVALEWMPDRFLDIEGALIVCGTHGARFRIADGYCIYGPCRGQVLTAVALSIREGAIWLNDGEA